MLNFSCDLLTKCVKGTNTMLLYILKTFNNDSNFRNEGVSLLSMLKEKYNPLMYL